MQIAAWRKIEDYRASDLIEGDAGLRKIDDHRKFETLERRWRDWNFPIFKGPQSRINLDSNTQSIAWLRTS